jgi:hypothetical protein
LADTRAVVTLGDERTQPSVREVVGMRTSDVTRAVRIVEEHQAALLEAWRKYHGED